MMNSWSTTGSIKMMFLELSNEPEFLDEVVTSLRGIMKMWAAILGDGKSFIGMGVGRTMDGSSWGVIIDVNPLDQPVNFRASEREGISIGGFADEEAARAWIDKFMDKLVAHDEDAEFETIPYQRDEEDNG